MTGTPGTGERPPRVAGLADFVGRAPEMGELLAALERALTDHAGLVLLGGEPGIGKTRLAAEFATHAQQQGALVYWGRCWEAGGAPAYWPWIQSLRGLLGDLEPSTLADAVGPDAPEIAQLLPEIRVRLGDVADPAPASPETARFRLFDAIGRFLTRSAQLRPLLIVLEDLHAADVSSLLLLQFVSAVVDTSPLLVVGTFRDVEVTPEHPLAEALADIVRSPQTSRITLAGLLEEEAAHLIEDVAGQVPSPALVSAIHRDTGGNPLFVSEIARLLASEDRLSVPGGAGRWPIPEGVGGVIGRRMERLPARCREILELAAVLGQEFAVEPLQHVTGAGRPSVLDCVRIAVDAHLLREVPGHRGSFQFAHALVRDALYQALMPTDRARLHRVVGEALEVLYAADPEPHVAELAHHFLESARGPQATKAVDYATAAGKRAVRLLSFEEAARLFRAAHRALSDSPDEKLRCEVLLLLGDAQGRSGDAQASQETFLEAAEIATRLDLPEMLARAAIGYGGRFAWVRAGTDRHVIPLLRQALEHVGEEPSVLRVRLMSRLAGALRDQPAPKPRTSLARRAVAMARRFGDPDTLTYALLGLFGAVLIGPDGLDEMDAVADELDRLAESVGDRELQTNTTWVRFIAFMTRGDVWGARAQHDLVGTLAREIGQPPQQWYGVVMATVLALQDGRLADADTLIDRAATIGRRAMPGDAGVSRLFALFVLRREQGRLAELEDDLREAPAKYPGYRSLRCMVLAMLCDEELLDEARALFDQLATDDFAGFPKDNEWLFALTLLAEAAHTLDDRDRATVLYEQLLPYHELVALAASEVSAGPVARPLGLLAALLGHHDEAVAHFEDAIERCRRMGSPPWEAHAAYAYATILVPSDKPRAVELLTHALDICHDTGMTALGQRIVDQLDALGARPPRTGRLARSGPALTPREREVAGLVAEGLTNRQIAERLYLSERTVETHVQNIFMKLGFNTRTQIASWVVADRAST